MNNSNFYNDGDDEELFNAYEDSSADLKFRSIKIDNNQHGDYFASYDTQPAHYHTPIGGQHAKIAATSKSSSAALSNGCPSIPYGIAKTNFIIENTEYISVVKSVCENLNGHANFDFSFVDSEFMWKGKYLCGSCCFELEVNLYEDKFANAYTVAVRKVTSDSAPNGTFNNFYNAMKSALSTDAAAGVPARKAFCIPPMKCCVTVSDEEFVEGVQPIFRMGASSSCLESRIQSAKMLCDVSQKEARYLELSAFRPACVELLEALVTDESEDVRQHAVMAVASFAELASYKEALLHSCVLPVLFGLVENCSEAHQVYETAQVRRTAAAVLALLSRTHPYSVRSELHRQHCDVAGWLQRVSCLQDSRTREAALVVKAFLDEVSVDTIPMSAEALEEEALLALIR